MSITDCLCIYPDFEFVAYRVRGRRRYVAVRVWRHTFRQIQIKNLSTQIEVAKMFWENRGIEPRPFV